jgi:hypothetical protein
VIVDPQSKCAPLIQSRRRRVVETFVSTAFALTIKHGQQSQGHEDEVQRAPLHHLNEARNIIE